MSFRVPSRRLALHAHAGIRPISRKNVGVVLHIRHLPLLQAPLRDQRRLKFDSAASRKAYQEMISAPLASPSIFDEDLASATSAPGDPSQPSSVKQPRKVPLPAPSTAAHPSSPLYRTAQRVLDPDPRSSALWLRRRVIAHVRSLTSPQPYKRVLPARVRAERSERSVVVSSEPLPTSTKKLVHLARQIAGKRIDDAKLQMRLSKKKMARDVGAVLELARLRGIVGHGMGLGEAEKKRTDGATAATGDAPGQASAEAAADDSGSAVATTAAATVPALAQPRLQPKIQLKSGNWVSVPDPTAMYVAQAWVGRAGWRGMRVNHHGRGRMTQMWRPLTRIWIMLKEEKTRIREFQEREAKKAAKKPWVHLPNRPVTAQRSYYCW